MGPVDLRSKMQCPWCKKEAEFNDILKREGVCDLADLFPFKAQKSRDEEDFGRGQCTLFYVQCLECGFIHNKAFDLEAARRGYADEAYYQQKALTKHISIWQKNIVEKILSLVDKKGVFMEVAPGHGDLLRLLADKVNFIYSIDPSPTSSLYAKFIQRFAYLWFF